MKRYIDPENQRYQYQVVNTLNGCSIEVLVVPNGDLAAITQRVAEALHITLPEGFRMSWPQGKREAAEKELARLAAANGWTEVESPVG